VLGNILEQGFQGLVDFLIGAVLRHL
jgi:hypothetical protein